MLLKTKIFYEQLKYFLLRIFARFYGNPSRNKKVIRFDSKFAFFKEISLLMLTNQNKALFVILINQKLCIKIEQTSENSGESVFQGQL